MATYKVVFVSGELPLPKFQILQIDSCDVVVVFGFLESCPVLPRAEFFAKR